MAPTWCPQEVWVLLAMMSEQSLPAGTSLGGSQAGFVGVFSNPRQKGGRRAGAALTTSAEVPLCLT